MFVVPVTWLDKKQIGLGKNPEDLLMDKEEGPEVEKPEVVAFALSEEEFERLLGRIPPFEQDLLLLIRQGKRQKDVGELLGVTQADISHRRKRAISRLQWLSGVGGSFTEEELLEDLRGHFMAEDIQLLGATWRTTCQQAAFREVFGNEPDCGRANHRLYPLMNHLSKLGEKHPHLKVYAHGFEVLRGFGRPGKPKLWGVLHNLEEHGKKIQARLRGLANPLRGCPKGPHRPPKPPKPTTYSRKHCRPRSVRGVAVGLGVIQCEPGSLEVVCGARPR